MKFEDAFYLEIPDNFGPYENQESNDSLDYLYNQLDSSVCTNFGASQFVIINNDWDKVIKIPFDGCYEYDEDNDEISFFEFWNDYCALTLDIYKKAEAAGVAPLFAKIEKLTDFIYAQERIEYPCAERTAYPTAVNKTKYKENSLNIVKEKSKTNNLWCLFKPTWLAKAIDYYGITLVNNFLTFCSVNNLSDFHSDNYGYRADGAPVVFDYCGFDG